MKTTISPYTGVRGLSPVRSRGLSPVRSFLLAILFLVLASTASAAPLKWVCNWPESSAKTFSLYHGETATFEPSFVVNGKAVTNLAIDAVYYQTNGMDGAWWRLDNATFAPSNDCGAASYRFFVRAVGADGVNYRANGLLRMTDSPGFTPSEVTPPVRRLDFSTVELVNAPYYTRAETNDKIVELSIAPDLSGYATLEALAAAAAAATNHTDSATNTIAIASNAAAIEANTLGVSTNAGNIARLESLLAAKADASRFTTPSNTTNDYWVCDNWGEELFFKQRYYDEYGWPWWEGTNRSASVLVYEPASNRWTFIRFDYAAPPYFLPGTISDTFLDFGDGVTVTRHNVNPLEPVVYQSDIPPAVSNVVTKAFVESLGISADFSTNNTELVETIAATSPSPGDYAAVSNAAVYAAITNALQDADISTLRDSIPSSTNALAQALAEGSIEVRAASARFADEADVAGVAGMAHIANGLYGENSERTADEIFTSIDAATTTNALQETAIGELSNDNAQTRQIVTTWENFLDGSNVVFSITNYLSGAYNLDAAKLRILELRDGEYHEVYNSRDEILLHIDDFSNRYVRVAINAIVDEVANRLASKADRDWGKYTSAGGEAPSNTVYMTAPNTVFAGGLEYERVAVGEGSICVLTTRGAPVWTQGDEGTFKFQDDGGTNYFGFAKTDSYTIGAKTDGITVQSGMVTMQYNITMSGRPCVWYKSTLSPSADWEQLNLPDGSPVPGATYAVSWEQNPTPGTQVCYLNVGNSPQGFFRATVEVAGEAKFMTNMPADLSGGIISTNTATGVNGVIRPTFNGSNVIWNWSAK